MVLYSTRTGSAAPDWAHQPPMPDSKTCRWKIAQVDSCWQWRVGLSDFGLSCVGEKPEYLQDMSVEQMFGSIHH